MSDLELSESARRKLEVRELQEWDTQVYVVSVIDQEAFGVVHGVFAAAANAVDYAHTCHLCLTEGEHLLIEGFQYGGGFDPTSVRVDRPDLVEPTVIEVDESE